MPTLNTQVNKNTRIIYILGVFIFLFSFLFFGSVDISSRGISFGINEAQAACPLNTADCNYSGLDGCEIDLTSDNNNCGACGKVCTLPEYCDNGNCFTPAPPTGGFVPCGRIIDDQTTPLINEHDPCNICAGFYMLKNVVNFVLTMAIGFGVFVLVLAGLLYALSGGNSGKIQSAKKAVKSALIGLAIVFSAWLLIAVILQAMGYANMASWNQVNCNVAPGGPATNLTFCGDGFVNTPNGVGFTEQCEPGEIWANFQARGAGTQEQWVNTIYRCQPDCTLACGTLPPAEVAKIGGGCWLDPNGNGIVDAGECQKGKYVCDNTVPKVACEDVFGDAKYIGKPQYTAGPIYDYCCNGVAASGELADGKIMGAPFDVVKATTADLKAGATGYTMYADFSDGTWCAPQPGCNVGAPLGGFGAGIGFRCDDVCKNMGKVCVGVGLTDPSVNRCVYVQHDNGSVVGGCNNGGMNVISMDLPGNQASTNCDAWFGMYYYSNNTGTGLHYSTGYDKYEYHCEKYDPLGYWELFQPLSFNFADVPVGSEGVCKPLAPDTCGFHGFDLIETACYCL